MAKKRAIDPADRKMGARVTYWRRKHDLTLRDLAEKIEVDKSALSRIERGEQSIKPGQIDQLLSLFKLTIAQFYRPEIRLDDDAAKGRGVAA